MSGPTPPPTQTTQPDATGTPERQTGLLPPLTLTPGRTRIRKPAPDNQVKVKIHKDFLPHNAPYDWNGGETFYARHRNPDSTDGVLPVPNDKKGQYEPHVANESSKRKNLRNAHNLVNAPNSVIRTGQNQCVQCIRRSERDDTCNFGCITTAVNTNFACAECVANGGAARCEFSIAERGSTDRNRLGRELGELKGGLETIREHALQTVNDRDGLTNPLLALSRKVDEMINAYAPETGTHDPARKERVRTTRANKYVDTTLTRRRGGGPLRGLNDELLPARAGPSRGRRGAGVDGDV